MGVGSHASKMENTILIVVGAILAISILFDSAASLFPNWSSVAGIPSIVVTIMPYLTIVLFVFIVLGLVKKSRS